MSKLENKPISLILYDNLDISIYQTIIKLTGPLGSREIECNSEVYIQDGLLICKRLPVALRSKIINSIIGITTGFQMELVVTGVGYRVEKEDNILKFRIGYANEVEYVITEDVSVTCPTNNDITIFGTSKEKVTKVAAEIRKLKKVDIYKGKGILYSNEVIKLKEGKKQ